MTTINMKDYVEENANKGNEAAREVMETISTIEPIVGNKNRTPEEKASDIGELKGILKAAIASGKSKVIVSVVKRLRTPEVRLINGIPFDEFESEIEFKKLPKDWTYNTRLWEESIDQWKYEKYVAEFGTVNVKDTKRIQELFDNGLLVIAPIVDKFIEAEIDHGFYRIVKKAHGYPLGYGEHNDYYPDDVFDTYEECEKHLKIQRENRYKNHIYCRLLDVYENIDWALEKYEADHGGREIEFIKQKLLSIPRIWEYMFRYYKGQILKGKREEKNEEWEVIA